MVPSPLCDFCGRSRAVLPYPSLADQPKIELDEKIAVWWTQKVGQKNGLA